MLSRIPLYILFISLSSAQYTRVKCPFDATYIRKTNEYKMDEEIGEILWKYECGGLTKHPFFVHHNKAGKTDVLLSLRIHISRGFHRFPHPFYIHLFYGYRWHQRGT
jgi:hypothetical protein